MRATSDSAETTPRPRWRRRLAALGRGGLVAAFVALLAGGWVYHSARAQMDEQLFALGTQMMAYEHALHQDAPRDLVINEQVLRMSSGTTARTATEVLDFFEARCEAADGELALQLEQLDAEYLQGSHALPERPTIREDDGERGYVACLDLGPQSVTVTELGERLARFGRTGDVAEIGEVRFVFAEQAEIDGETRTHFVGMWTEGSFDIDRMFPAEGDAPGADIDGVSRPPRARRTLSAHERGTPYRMSGYASPLNEAELEAFYRRDLAANGWSILEPAEPPPAAVPTLVAERGERMVTVMFQPDPVEGGSQVAIFDTR